MMITNNTENIQDLTNKLKKEDARNLKISRFFIWFSWLLVPAVAAYEFSHEHNTTAIKVLIICIFIGIALFYTLYNKSFKNIDYSKSTMQMMKDAVKRHKFIQPRTYIVFVAFIIIDITMLMYMPNGIAEITYSPSMSHFLVVQSILIPALALGMGIEYFMWFKKQKPIKDALSKLLLEME